MLDIGNLPYFFNPGWQQGIHKDFLKCKQNNISFSAKKSYFLLQYP